MERPFTKWMQRFPPHARWLGAFVYAVFFVGVMWLGTTIKSSSSWRSSSSRGSSELPRGASNGTAEDDCRFGRPPDDYGMFTAVSTPARKEIP
jgi:hypothetical protein